MCSVHDRHRFSGCGCSLCWGFHLSRIAHMHPYMTYHPPHSVSQQGSCHKSIETARATMLDLPPAAAIEGNVRSLQQGCPKFFRYLSRGSTRHCPSISLRDKVVDGKGRIVGGRPEKMTKLAEATLANTPVKAKVKQAAEYWHTHPECWRD